MAETAKDAINIAAPNQSTSVLVEMVRRFVDGYSQTKQQ
jgi:hypothetical protein